MATEGNSRILEIIIKIRKSLLRKSFKPIEGHITNIDNRIRVLQGNLVKAFNVGSNRASRFASDATRGVNRLGAAVDRVQSKMRGLNANLSFRGAGVAGRSYRGKGRKVSTGDTITNIEGGGISAADAYVGMEALYKNDKMKEKKRVMDKNMKKRAEEHKKTERRARKKYGDAKEKYGFGRPIFGHGLAQATWVLDKVERGVEKFTQNTWVGKNLGPTGSMLAAGAVYLAGREYYQFSREVEEATKQTVHFLGVNEKVAKSMFHYTSSLQKLYKGEKLDTLLNTAKALQNIYGGTVQGVFQQMQKLGYAGLGVDRDALENMAEYATFAKQAGYSIEEFGSILKTAFQMGTYKDKFIDSIKEIVLRVGEASDELRTEFKNVFGADLIGAVQKGKMSVKELLEEMSKIYSKGGVEFHKFSQLFLKLTGAPGEDVGGIANFMKVLANAIKNATKEMTALTENTQMGSLAMEAWGHATSKWTLSFEQIFNKILYVLADKLGFLRSLLEKKSKDEIISKISAPGANLEETGKKIGYVKELIAINKKRDDIRKRLKDPGWLERREAYKDLTEYEKYFKAKDVQRIRELYEKLTGDKSYAQRFTTAELMDMLRKLLDYYNEMYNEVKERLLDDVFVKVKKGEKKKFVNFNLDDELKLLGILEGALQSTIHNAINSVSNAFYELGESIGDGSLDLQSAMQIAGRTISQSLQSLGDNMVQAGISLYPTNPKLATAMVGAGFLTNMISGIFGGLSDRDREIENANINNAIFRNLDRELLARVTGSDLEFVLSQRNIQKKHY